MKMKIILGALTAALLITGCTDTAAPVAEVITPVAPVAQVSKAEVKATVSEESLGLRKTDLYSENTTAAEKTEYGQAAAGTSQKFDRAFDNAPPMIPHSVEGLLPITRHNNTCIGCHAPAIASSVGATAIPASHFTSFRPVTSIADNGKIVKEGKEVNNTSDFKTVTKTLDHMNQARFNCSQCHAPQSQGNLLVENNFRPDFQSEDMKHGSSLLDTLNTGVE